MVHLVIQIPSKPAMLMLSLRNCAQAVADMIRACPIYILQVESSNVR
jgi:hypothetical protein